jgi:hypothetical protein
VHIPLSDGWFNTNVQFKLLTIYRARFDYIYSPASDSTDIRSILSVYIHVHRFEHQRVLIFAVVFQNINMFVVTFQYQLIFAVLSRNRISVVLCSESYFRGPLFGIVFPWSSVRNRISVVLCSESHFRGPLTKYYFRAPLSKFFLAVLSSEPHFHGPLSYSYFCGPLSKVYFRGTLYRISFSGPVSN